jgi:hypothetical protein
MLRASSLLCDKIIKSSLPMLIRLLLNLPALSPQVCVSNKGSALPLAGTDSWLRSVSKGGAQCTGESALQTERLV